MGNPNPFYRFKQAWNAGFYPDNQIMTDLINEMVGQLTIDLPSIWPGKTIDGLYYAIKQWVKTYEELPYFGRFDFTIQKILQTPNNEYNINVFNPDMAALNLSGAGFTVNGFYNPTTKIVVNSNVNAFTPGSFSGSFAEPLIQEEVKVSEALEIVNINGSAIFPITYSFNPTTNVATSGLARGDNWFIDGNGNPDRQPVPNLPYENRRTFDLPALNGDDTYLVSVMERIIQASLNDTNVSTSILVEYNKYTMPDGWTSNIANPSFTTYERVQINFVNNTRRKFILVGRLDGTWKWQRFVSDVYGNAPYNFLTAYSETNPMPYEPNQAGRWIYNNDTFDYEFVDFTSGCYVSPEFYPMPSKPGDQYQFNIVDGNLTGIDSVDIGLFKENGEFVQKIGDATKPVVCNCTYEFTYTYSSEDFSNFRLSINGEIVTPPQIYYTGFYLFSGSELIAYAEGLVPNDFLVTPEETITYLENLSNNQFTISGVINEDDSVTFTVTPLITLECVDPSYLASFQTGRIIGTVDPAPVDQFTQEETQCCLPINQFQGQVTIPSLNGCYRMGLYNPPSTTCDLTFTYTLEGEDLTNYLNSVNGQFESLNPYISWSINGTPAYVYTITSGTTTASDIAAWCNSNIPGMTCTEGEGSLTWTWNVDDLPCNDSYSMFNCISDITGDCLVVLWSTGAIPCVCGTSYSLYSLSNIINIDASECFSTMLEFWGDNNSIAQGFEYFNNWKQKVRIGLNGGGEKPVIEESLYRQSNGVHRRPQNKQDLSIDLHTDFFDLETQLAMTDATRHPYIVWNGYGIFVKGDLEVATIQDFTTETSFEQLAQMKFQVLKQGFQPKNSSCLNC
jgi:hypothetical protein